MKKILKRILGILILVNIAPLTIGLINYTYGDGFIEGYITVLIISMVTLLIIGMIMLGLRLLGQY